MINLTENEMLSLSASLILFISLLSEETDEDTVNDIHVVIDKTFIALGRLNDENKNV